MSRQSSDWSSPQRQSGSALLILLVKALLDILKFAWPFLLIYIFSAKSRRADQWEIIILVISVLTLFRSVINYVFFKFSIVKDELVIQKGLLIKESVVLPLGKIQAVHIEQSWLHLLLNSASVSFDSAGSEKIEVKISAISKEKAELLREFILGKQPGPSLENLKPVMTDHSIISLSGSDLLKLCISANHLEAFFILLAFLFSFLDNIETILGDKADVWKQLMDFTRSSTGNLILFLVIAGLVISILISSVRTVLRYANFRISSSLKGFRIHTGLINIKEKLIPYSKIQFIAWKANWVRVQMGLYMLRFHAAGSEDVKAMQQEIKVPVTRKEFIPEILQLYYPLLPVHELPALGIHRLYIIRRTLFRGVIPVSLVIAATYWFWGANSFWLSVLIPLSAIHAWLFYRKFRFWSNKDAIQIHKGVYGEEKLVMQWIKIQSIQIQQSIYQRRKGLANLVLYTAGGAVTIPYITMKQAGDIQKYALYKIESSDLSWM